MPLTPAASGSLATTDPATGLPVEPSSVAAASLTDSATVYRAPTEDTDQGGIYEGRSGSNDPRPVATYACHIEKPRTPGETDRGGVITTGLTYTLYFPPTADIRASDSLKVLPRGSRSYSVFMEILGIDDLTSDSVHLLVYARKIGDRPEA